MSNKHIENLTVRLLQALDKNYDVVNMDAVLSVIAALESTKITKEQLEATRLAKYINLFRRRTKSEQLAKRAKSLLKRWREMVGMQQRPLSSCNELIRNESATSSNFQENINLVEGTSSLQHNPAISYITSRSLYSSSSTTDKILDHNKIAGKMSNKTAPTSFSDVLAGFSGVPTDRNNPPSFTNFNVANGPSARRKNCNLKRSAESSAFPEAFTYDQQSNLSSLGNRIPVAVPTKLSANTEPIIIDIEDSNSGSNLIASTARLDKEGAIVVIGPTVEKPNKHKKTKKDKKRTRERESFQELSAPLVVIDAESSHSEQSNLLKLPTSGLAEKELTSVADDKSRSENLMVTNMSEILSLSNSSMSSVFPTSSVGATKNLFSQHGNRPLSESDLSFAGKFSQQSGSTLSPIVSATAATVESKNNFLTYSDAAESKITAGFSGSTNSFQPFAGTGCISNDSASNSRNSTLEIIDSSSQGNKTQLKRLESDLSFPMHRPKFATNKDAVVERQQQHSPMVGTTQPQVMNTSSATVTQMLEQKVPKKRGRKKGSKGIDSLIAKDTSLSSQMLIQSLGSGAKKVKTTKELYADMQNRKLGVSTPTTPSHWTGAQSQTFVRRDSFCSEPSLHSPRTFDACSTNATVSTIATSSTPEKISIQRHAVDIDSGSDSMISGGQSRESVALISRSEKAANFQNSSSSKFLTDLSKKQCASNVLTAVESQLRKLADKLPAALSKEEIEMEMANDTVPCTCKILEILPKQVEQDSEVAAAAVANLLSLDALKASNANALKDDSNEPVITISVEKIDFADSHPSAITATIQEPSIKNEPQKPQRSIFDLDFEDDEDPLQTLIAEVAAASGCSRIEDDIPSYSTATTSKDIDILAQAETIKDHEIQTQQYGTIHDQQLSLQETPVPPPAFPTYRIEEDEACLAKQRFELQVQKITNFHIIALHNCYIPNVNGNWDDAFIHKSSFKGINVDCVAERVLPDGSNVVPKYCSFDSDEYIRKDLREIDFDRNFKPKPRSKAVEQLFYEKPFLGVSRCLKNLKSSHRKTRKHRKIHEPEVMDMENTKKLDNSNIMAETNDFLDDGDFLRPLDTTKDRDESYSRCSEMISNPPLKVVFDDITINVGETLAPIVKGNTATETPNLLAIASNVNFNNNQIENNLAEENATEQKSYVNKFEKEIANMDMDTQGERITFSSDNGDIKNNNNFNDKMEESSCESHSSLKQTQKSINLKLRKHRRQIIEQEQNSSKSYSKRKRRRKKSSSRGKRQKIKCIRIAINGGITTQRHIKMGNISDDESESDSYASNSDGTETHAVHDSETENEASENSDVEKDLECTFKSGESEWDQEKDLTISEHEDVDEEEDFEYDDEDELEEEDEYSGEFHEVVTRDISPSSESGNNHIVLTIKKTPSKTNSPCGSLPPVSPVVSGYKVQPNSTTGTDKIEEKADEILKEEPIEKVSNNKIEPLKHTMNKITFEDIRNSLNMAAATANKTVESVAYTNFLQKYKLKCPLLKRKRRLLRRKNRKCKPFRFPDELRKKGDTYERVFKKLHQQLFFPHEIYIETTGGSKRRMFDISSCSSSCAEVSEYEDDSLSDKDVKSDKIVFNKIILPASESDENSSSEEGSTADNEAVVETSTIGEKTSENKVKNEEQDEILPEDNNGLLVSFNNICTPSSALEVSTDSVAKTIKCDEPCSKELSNSEIYSNLLGHRTKTDSTDIETIVNNENKSHFIPRLEYTTGLRPVNEDIKYEDGNNCSRSQQFREWHQLLQRRSYNDELLTVLPYVVLD